MDIMQAILDIEQKAQGIIDSADVLKEEQMAELDAEVERIEKEANEKLTAEIDEYMNKRKAEIRTKAEKTEQDYQKRLSDLEGVCAKKKKTWIDEITKHIIED